MPDRHDERGSSASATCTKPNLGRANGVADDRFDRWLSWRLHDAYDSVLKEKLPAELEHMMRQLGARLEQNGHSDRLVPSDARHHPIEIQGHGANGASSARPACNLPFEE